MIKNKTGKAHRVLFVILLIILAGNLTSIFFQYLNYYLIVDEYQHAHVAWHVNNGKILYKDFFEHHGALFGLLNGLLLKLFNLPPLFSTLYFFKALSLFYTLLILLFTFLIAKRITASSLISLFAVTLLSANYIFVKVTVQHRPDILQNVFFLGGIFVLLDYLKSKKKRPGIVAGVFFGLTLESNPKSVIVLFTVLLFYIFIHLFYFKKLKAFLVEISWVLLGGAIVKSAFILFFLFNGVLYEYFYYNYYFNFMLKNADFPELTGVYSEIYFVNMFGFTAIVLTGFYFLFQYVTDRELSINKKQNHYLLLFTAGSVFLIMLLNLYEHSHLMFLPMVSITGAWGFSELWKLNKFKPSLIKKMHLFFNLALIFVTSYNYLLSSDPFTKHERLIMQEKEAVFLLEHTTREQIVPHFFGVYGGALFNEDLHYYWFPYLCNNTGPLLQQIEGYDVYGDTAIRLLEENQAPYLILQESGDFNDYDILSGELLEYIYGHYKRVEGLESVWVRE